MATYTVDWFMTLDGFGSGPEAYWGKDGPELREQRAQTSGGRRSEPYTTNLPDIDLELVDSQVFDGRMQQLVYVPIVR